MKNSQNCRKTRPSQKIRYPRVITRSLSGTVHSHTVQISLQIFHFQENLRWDKSWYI